MIVRSRRAFTFVELMTVLGIISILAGIALPKLLDARGHAVDSKVAATVRHVASAEEAYYADRTRYAAELGDLDGVVVGDVTITISAGTSGDLASSFTVHGSHPGAPHAWVWVSDPPPGKPNLVAD